MITELRCIVFSEEALLDAIRLASMNPRSTLPRKCTIRGVEISPKPDFHLLITIEGAGGKARTIRFSGEEVAVTLIWYCKKQRIPLPRHAQKKLEIYGDNLSLVLAKATQATPLWRFATAQE